MSNIRCNCCGRFYAKKVTEEMCVECQRQLKDVTEKLKKRYGGAVKRLAER